MFLVLWRLVNASHYSQGDFVRYLSRAGRERYLDSVVRTGLGLPVHPATPLEWLSARATSVANTLIPLRLYVFDRLDASINGARPGCYALCNVVSPRVVPFTFQYWTTLPFGMGIAFFPLLVVGLTCGH